MKWVSSALLALLALFSTPVHAAVAPDSSVVPGSYIVTLRQGIAPAQSAVLAAALTKRYGGTVGYVYDYALVGFSVRDLSLGGALRLRRDRRVAAIEPVIIGRSLTVESQPPEVSSPFSTAKPLDRVDQRSTTLDHLYYYQRTGLGVHVYVVDTGIYTRHNEFGGRAYPLFDFSPPVPGNPSRYSEAGGRGYSEPTSANDFHGTAVASQLGGRHLGVARNCLLYSVRVGTTTVAANGTIKGTVSSDAFVKGINAVIADVVNNNKRPAIINASISFPINDSGAGAVESAINNAINNNGILVVTGAGNDSGSTTSVTPQRMNNVLVIGATAGVDSNPDLKAKYSNTGASVDAYAVGGDFSVNGVHWVLRLAKAQRTYETDGWVGTSFAAPVATGVAAMYLETNPGASPFTVESAIRNNATTGFGTVNRIVYSGCAFLPQPTDNPIDDSRTFVRQHYFDFLSRQPDPSGENFWTQGIENCAGNAQCRHEHRVDTSRAFFLSREFQETGGYVYRLNRISFGSFNDDNGEKFGSPQPRMERFFFDQRKVGEGFIDGVSPAGFLEGRKDAFVQQWIARARFQQEYGGLSNADFVNKLYATAGVTDDATRTAQIQALDQGAQRWQVVETIADSGAVRSRFNNEAMVLMCYFAYLRRNPDDAPDADWSGFNFWLGDLNAGRKNAFELCDAFISAPEYRARFFDGPGCNAIDGAAPAPADGAGDQPACCLKAPPYGGGGAQ